MVPALSYEISRASYYSGYYLVILSFIYWTFTTYGLLFQNNSIRFDESNYVVRTPDVFLLLVWALSISLATTLEIDFSFFSYGY